MNVFFGICLIAVGLWMGYIRKKKRFNRRNQYGVEEFKSFEHSVGADFGDKVIGFIAAIFVIVGGGMIMFSVMTA